MNNFLRGREGRSKAKNSTVNLQPCKKQLSKIITFVSHSLFYRFQLKNILQEAQFSNSKHIYHLIWSISLLLSAYTLQNSLTDRFNPNSLRYYIFYEDRGECDKRDRQIKCSKDRKKCVVEHSAKFHAQPVAA